MARMNELINDWFVDEESENKRSLHSLRIFSLKVKQIVQERTCTTYKEIEDVHRIDFPKDILKRIHSDKSLP